MPYIPLPGGFFKSMGKELGSLACFPLESYALSKFLELMVCGSLGLAQTRMVATQQKENIETLITLFVWFDFATDCISLWTAMLEHFVWED